MPFRGYNPSFLRVLRAFVVILSKKLCLLRLFAAKMLIPPDKSLLFARIMV